MRIYRPRLTRETVALSTERNSGRLSKRGSCTVWAQFQPREMLNSLQGMCGDYNSVIGMNKFNSLNKFFKKEATKHFPATGEASLCGVIVEANTKIHKRNKLITLTGLS